jgi:hypothetical protein
MADTDVSAAGTRKIVQQLYRKLLRCIEYVEHSILYWSQYAVTLRNPGIRALASNSILQSEGWLRLTGTARLRQAGPSRLSLSAAHRFGSCTLDVKEMLKPLEVT